MGRCDTVSAQLAVRGGRAAVDFYIAAFGAREVHRVGGGDEHEAVVSQLSVGGGSFGWRLGRIVDPFGHHW